MKLIADYHIHSKNCKHLFACGTIEQIARRANAIGLKEIAITDHGYKHFNATSFEKLKQAKATALKMSLELGMNVYIGIEADIISKDGELDVDRDTLDLVDILIIGYHKFIKTDFSGFFGNKRDDEFTVQTITDAYINAIKRYDVDIVAHPNVGVNVDLYQLGVACKENGVLIELNNRHCNYSEQQVRELIESDCNFVLSSDAYKLDSIGRVENAMILVEQYNISLDKVVNVLSDNGTKKSELDLEIERDIERYDKVMAKRNNKSSYDLSPEIEYELRQISIKKGIIEEIEPKDDYKDFLSDEERELVERAEKFIKTGKK